MTFWYAGLGSTQTCIPDGHLHTVTCIRCRIDTINSPDDEHMSVKKCRELNKHLRKKIVRQVRHLQELYRDARSTEHKK